MSVKIQPAPAEGSSVPEGITRNLQIVIKWGERLIADCERELAGSQKWVDSQRGRLAKLFNEPGRLSPTNENIRSKIIPAIKECLEVFAATPTPFSANTKWTLPTLEEEIARQRQRILGENERYPYVPDEKRYIPVERGVMKWPTAHSVLDSAQRLVLWKLKQELIFLQNQRVPLITPLFQQLNSGTSPDDLIEAVSLFPLPDSLDFALNGNFEFEGQAYYMGSVIARENLYLKVLKTELQTLAGAKRLVGFRLLAFPDDTVALGNTRTLLNAIARSQPAPQIRFTLAGRAQDSFTIRTAKFPRPAAHPPHLGHPRALT